MRKLKQTHIMGTPIVSRDNIVKKYLNSSQIVGDVQKSVMKEQTIMPIKLVIIFTRMPGA